MAGRLPFQVKLPNLDAAAIWRWTMRALPFGAILIFGLALGVTVERSLNFSERAGARAVKTWDSFSRATGLYKEPDERAVERRQVGSFFYDIDDYVLPLGPFDGGRGGAFSEFGDGMIFIEPKGQLGYVSFAGDVRREELAAPMNMQGFIDWLNESQQGVYVHYFRIMDTLLRTESDDAWTLFVSHQRFADNCIEFVISAIGVTADADGAPIYADDGWRDVFVARPCIPLPPDAPTFEGIESGGRMVLRSPDTMLVTLGHFGFDGLQMQPALAQDPDSHLGKVIELDIASGAARIVSLGHRNPQGLTIDRDGRIWSTSHGPNGGDELNMIERGRNYGWPNTTFGLDYGQPRADWEPNDEQGWHTEKYEAPKFFFSPSMGISNLVEMRGDEFPLWDSDLLVGSLSRNMLMRMRRDGDRILSVEYIPMGERLRDIALLRDGRLALLTDEGNIHVMQRARPESEAGPTPPGPTLAGFHVILAARASDPLADQQLTFSEQGRRIFNGHCAQCHSLDGSPSVGPSLRGIYNRKLAADPDFPYSEALREAGGRWDYDRLHDYIIDPHELVPGTSMPDPGVHVYDAPAVATYLAEN